MEDGHVLGKPLPASIASPPAPGEDAPMKIGYLEIVTVDVAATCGALEAAHGTSFSEPCAALGGARTVELEGGGRLG